MWELLQKDRLFETNFYYYHVLNNLNVMMDDIEAKTIRGPQILGKNSPRR